MLIAELGDHTLLLNKFALIHEHFLLVTRGEDCQTLILASCSGCVIIGLTHTWTGTPRRVPSSDRTAFPFHHLPLLPHPVGYSEGLSG